MAKKKVKKDFEGAISLAKALAFAVCLSACLYEIVRAYLNFRNEDLGTKIEVLPNKQAGFSPFFAICLNNEDMFHPKGCLQQRLPHFLSLKAELWQKNVCELSEFVDCLDVR